LDLLKHRQVSTSTARRKIFSSSVVRSHLERSRQFSFYSWYWQPFLLKPLRPTTLSGPMQSTLWLVPIAPTGSARTISDETSTAESSMALGFLLRWGSLRPFSAPCLEESSGSSRATSVDGW